MEKSLIVIKTEIKALLNDLIKKLLVMLFVLILFFLCNRVKNNLAQKYNLTDSIFSISDPFAVVSMLLVYIVLGVLLILLIVALYKLFSLFYELKRVTVIDFVRGKIIIESYDFPFDKQIEEKKFDNIIGVDIIQKSIDRTVNSGTLYLEYLVLSKNDSKLRGMEIPNVSNPMKIKDRLLNN